MNINGIKRRVRIEWNTGTRIIRSKKDKMRSRQYLNRLAKEW